MTHAAIKYNNNDDDGHMRYPIIIIIFFFMRFRRPERDRQPGIYFIIILVGILARHGLSLYGFTRTKNFTSSQITDQITHETCLINARRPNKRRFRNFPKINKNRPNAFAITEGRYARTNY